MAFKKPIDVVHTQMQLLSAYHELRSPYNDGFTQFELKKELYELKFVIDKILADSPRFSGEDEWLEEQSKKQLWETLKK